MISRKTQKPNSYRFLQIFKNQTIRNPKQARTLKQADQQQRKNRSEENEQGIERKHPKTS